MTSMLELDEKIAALRDELTAVEDRHSSPDWLLRDAAIRTEIHRLEAERDLLPRQRQP